MFVGPAPHPAEKAPAVSSETFREAMRELASGVAFATTTHEGVRPGCVVSSFASPSLTPPTMLGCVKATSATLRAIEASGMFALNILADDHEALAYLSASTIDHTAQYSQALVAPIGVETPRRFTR